MRQSHFIAPALQRLNGRTRVVINIRAQPAKTSHRVRALPRFMQSGCELHAIRWNQPRPLKRVCSAAKQCCNKRDMTICTRGERIVAHHDQP